jgi:hypothetical protein
MRAFTAVMSISSWITASVVVFTKDHHPHCGDPLTGGEDGTKACTRMRHARTELPLSGPKGTYSHYV